MGERQQLDCDLARPLVAHFGKQGLEGFAISRTGEQLIAVDQVRQRHWLPAQCVDYMPVVDDVTTPGSQGWPSTSERHHECGAEKAVEPIVVEMHPQTMADQPRGTGVENAAQHEAATRGHYDDLLLVIGGAPLGQLSKLGPFQFDTATVVGITPAHNLIDEAPVG